MASIRMINIQHTKLKTRLPFPHALLGVLFNGVCEGFITCLKFVKQELNIEQKKTREIRKKNDVNIATTNGTSYD
jgi:hypothetical protein